MQVGGRFTSTAPLSFQQWLICIGIGAIGLPLGVLMRYVPVPSSLSLSSPLFTRKSIDKLPLVDESSYSVELDDHHLSPRK